ncbi:MAG: hypothetical protein FVQ77_00690 [Cytophagales bacterium]|nr:hypothetical protein [Cytophagales bacterium]
MADLPEEILAQKEHIEITLENLKDAEMRSDKSVIELSAIATFIHNFYNGIENIIKQIYKIKHLTFPKSEYWHKELVQKAVSHGIISASLAHRLYDYLTFRHSFVHGYGYMLEEEELKKLSDNITDVWSTFLSEIEQYFNTDPAPHEPGN